MIDDGQRDEQHDESEHSEEAPAAQPETGAPEAGAEVENEGAQESPRSDAVDPKLQTQLDEMRSESDEIAALGTGDEQVERAERFVEAAGKFDEQLGAAARSESHSE